MPLGVPIQTPLPVPQPPSGGGPPGPGFPVSSAPRPGYPTPPVLGPPAPGTTPWPGIPAPLPPEPTNPLTSLLEQQLRAITAGGELDRESFLSRIANANALNRLGVDQLNQQYGFDAARLANDRFRNVDLARQGIADQARADRAGYGAFLADLARQLGLAQDAFGLARRNAQADIGFAHRTLGSQIQGTNAARGLAERGLLGQRDQNQLAFRSANRGLQSDATARGGGLSAGFRDDRADLTRSRNLADREAQLGFDRSITGIESQERANQIGFDERVAGARQRADAAGLTLRSTTGDIDFRRGEAGRSFDAAEADRRRARAMIDSVAKDYGIRAEELSATLATGIQRLGIDLNDTIDQLTAGFNASDAARRAQAQSVMQAIISAGMSGASTGSSSSSTGLIPQFRPTAGSATTGGPSSSGFPSLGQLAGAAVPGAGPLLANPGVLLEYPKRALEQTERLLPGISPGDTTTLAGQLAGRVGTGVTRGLDAGTSLIKKLL